jgi:hypothetical protein
MGRKRKKKKGNEFTSSPKEAPSSNRAGRTWIFEDTERGSTLALIERGEYEKKGRGKKKGKKEREKSRHSRLPIGQVENFTKQNGCPDCQESI